MGGGGGAPIGPGRQSPMTIPPSVLEEIAERESERVSAAQRRGEQRAIESLLEAVGAAGVRGLFTGAACAAAPQACPVIMALYQLLRTAESLKRIYDAFLEGTDTEDRIDRAVERAAIEAGMAVLIHLVKSEVGPSIDELSERFAESSLAAGVPNELGIEADPWKRLVKSTTRHLLRAELDGILTWSIAFEPRGG